MSLMADPARRAAVVSPSDTVNATTDLGPVRALYVGGTGGDISIQLKGNTSPVVFPDVQVGILPVRAQYVLATGTTVEANGIIALY